MTFLCSAPRRRTTLCAALAAAALGGVAAPASAKVLEEQFKVPVHVTNLYGRPREGEIVVTLWTDDQKAGQTLPVVVLNHGRAPDAAERAAMGRARYSVIAAWFARLGFVVVVPTRMGYGVSGGEDVEDSGPCDRKVYGPGYAAAADEVEQVLAVVRQRPGVSPDRGIVIGQSYGGTTSVTLAARNPAGLQATINFAGGGGGNPTTHYQNPCAASSLQRLFADYGRTARLPSLWIYTENDEYFGPTLPRQWFDAFQAEGGVGEFERFLPVNDPKGGHTFFAIRPEEWRSRVVTFLNAHGYPKLRWTPSATAAAAPPVVLQPGE